MKKLDFTALQESAADVAKRHLDTCVVAGPGSGKTTVLVEYFRRLVEGGMDPLRILAITFTEKAAANMREKLAEAFSDDAGLRAKMERAWVSTVHGFCTRLLKENAVFAGVDPKFRIADANEAWHMQQAAMAEAMEAEFRERPEAVGRLIRGLSSSKFEEAVLSAYDAMRGAGVRVEELAAMPSPECVRPADIARGLEELRRQSLAGWSGPQRQHYESALEAVEGILSAPGPLAALLAIEEFTCNLNQCKRGRRLPNY